MTLTPRFPEALHYAYELHAGQSRKGSNIPYLAHLLSVAALVLEHGATEDEAIAAVLHDAIEDQGGAPTRDEIRRRFGTCVADIVAGCSDADTLPKPAWRERKEAYLALLPAHDNSVHLVCTADKLHNARSLVEDYRRIGEDLWSRFAGGREGTLWYYRAAVDVLRHARPSALVEELERTVAELERMAGGMKLS